MNINKRSFDLLLIAAFFTSGFSALLYQVVWQRMLGLFSGSDVRSVTIVTGAYLAGLGVGSLLGASFPDRLDSRQAVRAYGFCNLGIALFALLSRFLFYDLLFKELSGVARSPLLVLLIVFISLLWPTILMGLSLPLLSKALVRNLSGAAGLISLLYGLNTFGAGIGTIVSGWYLIGVLGYEWTVYLGAFLTLLVAAAAFLIAPRFTTADQTPHASRITHHASPNPLIPASSIFIWCLLVFIAGYLAISLELLWFRVLDISLKSNAYTFSYLLFYFLVGDGLGSLLGARYIGRIHNPRRLFLWLQGLIALYSVLIIWVIVLLGKYEPLFSYFRQLVEPGADWSPFTNWPVFVLVPAAILIPPSILIGFHFPVVQKAVQTDVRLVGRRVGLVSVANILGNTAGSILTGTLMLHFLGTANSLRLIAFLGFLFIALLIIENFAHFKLPTRAAAFALAAALLVIVIGFPGRNALWATLHGARETEEFIVTEDSTGVAALRIGRREAIVFANGENQATIPFFTGHGLLGAVPALVHPNPEQLMIIGIGSGATPFGAGANPLTQEIFTVEIIGSELDLLEIYAQDERGLALDQFLNDPRYHIVIGDGRHELNLSQQRYDIIEADAIQPTSSHSGMLYSREFFESARAKLAEGGMMAQWRATDRVEATFLAVFPYVVNIGDFLLLGSDSPIVYDAQSLLDRLNDPAVIAYLESGTFNAQEMRDWALQATPEFWTPDMPRPSTDINTDLRPKDEYFLNNGQ